MVKNKIKILHTSDWHLGKRLFKKERLEEQIFFLNWLIEKIKNDQIDILIIAGDIFDVPSPPVDALTAYYDFLHKLGSQTQCEVIIISGNHDSKRLLDAPSPILKNLNCHIYTQFTDFSKLKHVSTIRDQKVEFTLLPYFRNYELFNLLEQRNLSESKEDIEKLFRDFFNNKSEENAKQILIAHHGFGEYSTGGSEQVIQLSGLDYFPLTWVRESFDYVALGHIHKKQTLQQEPPIVYTGAPLPMRFSESNKKYISLIEIDEDKLDYSFEQLPLKVKLHSIRTTDDQYEQALKDLVKEVKEETFLELIIDLQNASSGLADRAREILKGSSIELVSFIPVFNHQEEKTKTENINKLNINELFENYYKYKIGQDEVPTQITKSFHELLESVADEDS